MNVLGAHWRLLCAVFVIGMMIGCALRPMPAPHHANLLPMSQGIMNVQLQAMRR